MNRNREGEKIKGFKGIHWVMQKFSYVKTFSTAKNFNPCVKQAACRVKNKTMPPPPLLSACLTPLTPLTCIAGLVGVKIDWQRLNWKWPLSAACSCRVLSSLWHQPASQQMGRTGEGRGGGLSSGTKGLLDELSTLVCPWELRTERRGQGRAHGLQEPKNWDGKCSCLLVLPCR